MSDVTHRQILDAITDSEMRLTNTLRQEIADVKQELTTTFTRELETTKQELVVGATEQFSTISDNMVTKLDLRASERRQALLIKKTLLQAQGFER